MAEVESTHSNGKHSLEDSCDGPVKAAKLLKTENGNAKANGNGVAKEAEGVESTGGEGAEAKNVEEQAGGVEESSNDVLANAQSDVSKHNEESNTNDTNGETAAAVTGSGVSKKKGLAAGKAGQENSTSAYGDEDEEDGDEVDDEDEGDDDDSEDGDEDDEGDDDEGEEGPDGDDDDDDEGDDGEEGPDGDDDEEDDEEGDE